jgi:hypothetical protein
MGDGDRTALRFFLLLGPAVAATCVMRYKLATMNDATDVKK